MTDGELFGVRYEVLRSLGQGGMGVVYEVIDRERGAKVALKTAQYLDADALYRFKAEFRALADVAHPGLVSLYELVTEGSRPFFTMELVQGKTFLQWTCGLAVSSTADTELHASTTRAIVHAHAPEHDEAGAPESGDSRVVAVHSCNFRRLRSAARQLAEAVLALHAAGKVHRDLKPSNVLVTPEGRVVVLDFGLAVDLEPKDASRVNDITGTAAYMSPEQAAGSEITPASDWYSLGVMLYEALTGRLPFTGPLLQVLQDKQRLEPPAPGSLADVPDDLAALCVDLLQRVPAARPSGPDVLRRLAGPAHEASAGAAGTRNSEVPFVGRDQPMQQLRDAFRKVRSEREAVLVHVHGSSGMGKSALLARFTEELVEAEEAVVLTGRCYERETVPFKAVDSLVDAITRYLRKLPDYVVEALLPTGILALARVFPVLSRVRPVAQFPRLGPEIPDPQELRRRAFAAFRDFVRRLASRADVVLMLDDLQWGDSDSAVLLAELLRTPDPPPVLVVLSYRTEEADSSALLTALRATVRDVEQVNVEVAPLALADAQRLATILLAGAATRESQRPQRIAQESQGSPYFVDELVRFSRAGGGLDDVSLRLDDALYARISRLPDDAAALLRTVAVAGGIVPEEIATRAASLSGDAARKAPAQLRTDHLLRSMRSGTAFDTFHDRVRETVIAHLDAETLRRAHERLATTFLEAGNADPEVLTLHFGAAGDEAREAEWALAAARKAEAALAFGRAVELYRRILALGVMADQRLPLLTALGEALTNAGRWGEAAELRLALAEEVEPVRALQLRTVAAEQLLCSGRFDRGATALADVLRAVRVYVPRSPFAALLAVLCVRVVLLVRGLRYHLRQAELPPQEAVRIDTLLSAGHGFAMTDHVLGTYFNARALIRTLRSGAPERLLRALASETAFHATAGAKTEKKTAALLLRLRTLTEAVDTPLARALTTGVSGHCFYLVQNDFALAKPLFLESHRMLGEQCVGQFWFQALMRTFAFRAMMYLGDREELAGHVAGAFQEMEQIGDLFGLTMLRAGPIAWLRLAADQPNLADEEVAKVAEQLPRKRFILQTYWHALAAVQLALYRGQGEAAFEEMERTWRPLHRSLLPRVSTVRIEASEIRGRAALAAAGGAADRERERRLRLVEAIAGRLRRAATAWATGHAALLHAGACALRSRPVEARRLAHEAESAFSAGSMKLHSAASRWLGGACAGGDEGARMVAGARDAMTAVGVQRPEYFAAMLAPALRFV
jgi:hypothetical protein